MNSRISSITRQKTPLVSVLILLCVLLLVSPFAQKKEASTIFDNPSAVLIVLSPHFDDAALSVGGIIDQFPGEKYVVTFFSTSTTGVVGLTDWDKMSGFSKSVDSISARPIENALAGGILGAHLINAGYSDFQYTDRSSTTTDKSLETKLVSTITGLISANAGRSIYVLGPSYFGPIVTHPDHLALSMALVRVATRPHSSTVHFLLYEDFPYIKNKFGNKPDRLKHFLEQSYPGVTFDRQPHYLSAESIFAKSKSIQAYASQLTAFRSLGVDITREDIDFTTHRCRDTVFFFTPAPCEVLYAIK